MSQLFYIPHTHPPWLPRQLISYDPEDERYASASSASIQAQEVVLTIEVLIGKSATFPSRSCPRPVRIRPASTSSTTSSRVAHTFSLSPR